MPASDQTVCFSDVMATCAAMSGASLPVEAAKDSFDLLPVLLGKDVGKPVRGYTLQQTIILALPDPALDAPDQIYNLETDPGETVDFDFKHPEIVRELKALLESSMTQGRSAAKTLLP